LGASYGLTPDPWQELVLRSWLSRRRDGKWSASKCGLAVPRQNGKNAVVEIRELFGIVVLGERWLHTAHEVKTARKAFVRLSGFFENPRKYPELAELVADIRKTNGQEAIVLTNGGSVEFVARSKGSGRGFTVDGLLMDEAQELGDEALEALLPTTSASPLQNPQHIYTGTPPGPKANGEVFTRLRRAAIKGDDKRLSWLEWGAPRDADMDSPESWARANPGLGYRLGVDEIEGERTQLDDYGFGRERLGWWDDDESTDENITPAMWQEIADTAAAPGSPLVLALDAAPNLRSASIVACGRGADGLPVLELVAHQRGVRWVEDLLPRIVAANRPLYVGVLPGSPAGSLIDELERLGVELTFVDGGDFTRACGAFVKDVVEGAIRHRNEQALTSAVYAAARRPVGDAWKWSRRDSNSDISPLVAATLARHLLVGNATPLTDEQMLASFH